MQFVNAQQLILLVCVLLIFITSSSGAVNTTNSTNLPTKPQLFTTSPSKGKSAKHTRPATSASSAEPTTVNKPTKPPMQSTGAAKLSTVPANGTNSSQSIKSHCESRSDSCSACTDDSSCVYCSSEKRCYKKTSLIPSGCKGNHWYWRQCNITGNILIIVVPVVLGVSVIMIGCCIYCCCCRRCSKRKAAQEVSRQRQKRIDRQQRSEERKLNRQARHDAIRLKYGLLQNDDDSDTVA